MARYGLDPQTIVWDGRLHRFPGAGTPTQPRGVEEVSKDGWYVANPDRANAMFGDWSTGLDSVYWKYRWEAPLDEFERRRLAAERGKLDWEQGPVRAKINEQIQRLWRKATKPDPQEEPPHPHLAAKLIREPGRVRISTRTVIDKAADKEVPAGLLLVPMYLSGKLVNLQCIWADGMKQFCPGAPVLGTHHFIGLTKGEARHKGLVYICVGWETGCVIHEATGKAVVVAFTASGLRSVAEYIREKWHPERIVIAADRDRWSRIEQSGDGPSIPEPSVEYAREAAEAVGGLVAMPRFSDDREGRPTDFSDLRIREGMEPVRHYLDPRACIDVTAPEESDQGTEPDEKRVEIIPLHRDLTMMRPAWRESPLFRCLGYNGDTWYFVSSRTGEREELKTWELTNLSALLRLAPREWWIEHFGDEKCRGGFDAGRAGAFLMDQCLEAGVYEQVVARGSGCWRTEKGRFVMHLGDRLLAPGAKEYSSPERFVDDRTFYARRNGVPGPADENPLDLEAAQAILALIKRWGWEDEASGVLLAGWIVLAPFGGALPFRPCAWLAGPPDTGKTMLIEWLVTPLVSGLGMVSRKVFATNAWGVLDSLRGGTMPVVIDGEEMERHDWANLRRIFDLTRSSTTGGTVTRTRGGKPVDYPMRSMFLFASRAMNLKRESERSRVAILQLRNPLTTNAARRRKDWAGVQLQMSRIISAQQGRRLLARTAEWFRSGRFDALLEVTTDAACVAFRSSRGQELYGALLAGAWTLMGDEVPDKEEVVAWLQGEGAALGSRRADQSACDCLEVLLHAQLPVHVDGILRHVAIGDLIHVVTGDSMLDAKAKEVERALQSRGLMVRDGDLLIANTSEWVTELYEGTPFEKGWKRLLRRVPMANALKSPVRFGPGVQSRATAVPIGNLASPTWTKNHSV